MMLKVPKVDGICCFGLETSGKILGWWGLIVGILGTILTTALTIFMCSFPCDKSSIKVYVKLDGYLELLKEFSTENCTFMKFILVAFAVLCLVSTIINGFLLKGIRTRNPSKIIPAVILQGFEATTVLSFVLQSSTIDELIAAVIFLAIEIYILIVLLSLYVQVKDYYQRRIYTNISA